MRVMTKAAIAVIAVAVFFLSVTTLEAEIVQKCVNGADGFSIEFPAGWELREKPGEGVALIAVRPEEKAGESIYERMEVRVFHQPGKDLDAFLQRYIADLQDNLPAFTLVSRGSEELSGLQSRFLIYTFADTFFTLKVLAKAKQWIVRGDGRTYLITGLATVESFPRYEEAFGEIAAGFRLLK